MWHSKNFMTHSLSQWLRHKFWLRPKRIFVAKEFEHHWVEGENVHFQKASNNKLLVSVSTALEKELLVTEQKLTQWWMQCKVATFSISPRKLFSSFGSLFPSRSDSLFPRFLPVQALQSVIKKNEWKQIQCCKIAICFLRTHEKYTFSFASSLCPSIPAFPLFLFLFVVVVLVLALVLALSFFLCSLIEVVTSSLILHVL